MKNIFFILCAFLSLSACEERVCKINEYPPLFWEIVQQRNEQFEKLLAEDQQYETLFIGDSLMQGFQPYSDQHFKNSLNLAAAGERTDHLLLRLQNYLPRMKFKNLVLSISGNDLLQRCQFQQTQENRKQIVQAAAQSGVENIYWFAIPPFGDPRLKDYIQKHNGAIQKISGVSFIDTFSPLALPNGQLNPRYAGDGIHFNHLGYEEVWLPLISLFLNENL